MFNRIGLITNSGVREIRKKLSEVISYLNSKNREIYLNPSCAELTESDVYPVYESNELGKHCDLIIAIGGDGTMLMTAHFLCELDVPLLGINMGKVGFLSDIPSNNIKEQMESILNGDYTEEIRFFLYGQVIRDGKSICEDYALNDIIVQKWNIARMVELETYVNKSFVHTHSSDGMIVSSPTGSTAYALSGGGPIMHPNLDALLLVPICPHSLTNRPIVVEGNSCIEIVIGTRKIDQARLTFDGKIKMQLAPRDKVIVKKKTQQIKLIHPSNHDQFRILREKLHWSK